MNSNYIVRLKGNRLFSFYYCKNAILCREYFENKWSQEKMLINDVREHFSLTLNEQSYIYVICQNTNGDVILCTNESGKFQYKVVLENKNKDLYNILMTPIIYEKQLFLIYNADNNLVFQNADENGNWLPSKKIDEFTSICNSIYNIQRISSDHLIIFYGINSNDSSLGYRELTPYKKGVLNMICSSNFRIYDSAFLTTQNELHIVYIIRTLFSHKLFYRGNTNGKLSNPILLIEAPALDNCIIYFLDGKLYVNCTSNNNLLVCISNDNGRSFTKVKRDNNKVENCIKASYVCFQQQDEDELFTHQVYVDKHEPYEIKLFPSVYKNFYPVNEKRASAPFEEDEKDIDNKLIEMWKGTNDNRNS